ncbi:hypothetical protein ACIHCQ_42220 [Streptomyces sp. NPDC052236]|uniref:hypothetical protein n=1 Tax=Streptomyces sp. NPDC052236 TaxID=3365686 RepID=UPI0037CD7CB0
MPIRPENRNRYPDDWPEISRAVKDAAGWRCACTGECGRGTHSGRCPNVHDQPAYGTGSLVILTTAHLNHQPEDCLEANLVAMCQGCHLHLDRAHHRVTAALTRAAALEEAGQLAFAAVAALAVPTEPQLAPSLPAAAVVPYDVPLPLDIPPLPAPATTPKEKLPMARITATIKPVHDSGTVCTHPVTSTGKPRDAKSGCTGRTGYVARCSACTWRRTSKVKAELEYVRDSHLRSHLTAPVHANA